MRPGVNLFAVSILAFPLLAAPPIWAADSGQEGSGARQEGADRFVPSFAILSGIRIQPMEGATDSFICRDCNPGDMSVPLRPPAMGNDLAVTPYVTGSLELMTPELPLPGSPRLFFGGEFGDDFSVSRKVALEGSPGRLGSPLLPGSTLNFQEGDATGQGSEIEVTYGEFVYRVHAGIALPFEALGRRFRLRPSVGWTRFEIDLLGRSIDAECLPNSGDPRGCNPESPPGSPTFGPGFMRTIDLGQSRTETFDGIGPSLELEMETGRLGPFGTSILVGAGAYKILGDTRIAFDTQPTLFGPDPEFQRVDEANAGFRFEVDDWLYRMTVGIRFHWLGPSR